MADVSAVYAASTGKAASVGGNWNVWGVESGISEAFEPSAAGALRFEFALAVPERSEVSDRELELSDRELELSKWELEEANSELKGADSALELLEGKL